MEPPALREEPGDRQEKLTGKYADVIVAVRAANTGSGTNPNRLNGTHRPRYLLSGLLYCGVCGGRYALRASDRYACSRHVKAGSCSNGRSIRRAVIEERVMVGLRDRLMAPEAAEEAMRAYAEETNRLNRERRASGASDRQELAAVEKKIALMIAAIEDGGYVRGMSDKLRALEARQDEIAARLSVALPDLPDIHPNIAAIYRRKVERLSEALNMPEERIEAANAIRGLIERIELTPGEKWGETHATLHGDLATIVDWAAAGGAKGSAGPPSPGLSLSVESGAGFEPAAFRLCAGLLSEAPKIAYSYYMVPVRI